MVIAEQLVNEMVEHLQAHFPDEPCGIIAASSGVATKVYPIKNVSESPVVYSMDPQEQLQAFLDMDEKNWDLGAIFHSHTRTRAYPSGTDVKFAFYPDALQIIVSLATPEEPDVRAYRIAEAEISEDALQIVQ